MNNFLYSSSSNETLANNSKHMFAMQRTLMLYRANAAYSFIPKNACSTLRLSVAFFNGCIDKVEQFDWIHSNNGTFQANLRDAILADYTFIILRCPFRRLASVFLDKFVNKNIVAMQYRDELGQRFKLDELTFSDFIHSLAENGIDECNVHWRPQVDFLLYKRYSNYFSVEQFDVAIEKLREKIGLEVIDARPFTKHGIDSLKILHNEKFNRVPIYELSNLRRSGFSPSHHNLFDDDLIKITLKLYKKDFELYSEKISSSQFLFKLNHV